MIYVIKNAHTNVYFILKFIDFGVGLFVHRLWNIYTNVFLCALVGTFLYLFPLPLDRGLDTFFITHTSSVSANNHGQ